MLNALFLALRFLILVFSGHKQVALENAALRHQLAGYTRQRKPRLRDRDRLFWIVLKKLWKDWRSALEFVQPETAIGCHITDSNATGGNCPSRNDQDARECVWRFAGWSEPWLSPIHYGERRASMGSC
jgi:hypothetical protein